MSKSTAKRMAALKTGKNVGPLVTIAEYARQTGMTDPAIRGRIRNGHWREGVHYHRQGRRIMVDVDACKGFWAGNVP